MKLKIVVISIILSSCIGGKKGGTFPVFMDEYVHTTENRSFDLEHKLEGKVILNQISYPCSIDSIIYNATTVIKTTSGDTITVYSPCDQTEYKFGDKVEITQMDYNKDQYWTKRDIFIQFSRKSNNYPYYQCRSCKYENTIGKITPANNGKHEEPQ